MIEILITESMLHSAKLKAENVKNQKTDIPSKFGYNHDMILTGYLGEQLILKYLKTAIDVDDYQYDLLYNGLKIEVKTIACKFKPKEDYLCTVNSRNDNVMTKQDADYYIFTRIQNDMSRGWILGYMKCKEFFEKGTFISKGNKVADGVEFRRSSGTCLEISKLHKVKGDI